MAGVSLHEAQAELLGVLERAAAGEEIVISRDGQPIARLVPFHSASRRTFGADAGLFVVPDDFDAPLPDEVVAAFEQ